MAGVLETAWRSGKSTHEGYTEFKMTVYWHPGVCAVVLGTVWWEYAAALENPSEGALRGCLAVLGCPPDPSNNSGGAWGQPPGPVNKLEGRCLRSCT